MQPPAPSPPPPHRRRRAAVLAGFIAIAAAIPVVTWRAGKTSPSPAAAPLETIHIAPPPPDAGPAGRVRAALQPPEEPRGLARLDALRELTAAGPPLDNHESQALLAALLAPREPSEPHGPHAAWFHETALLLQQQENTRHQFARALATIARDTSRDHVVRDYALQHLCQLWHQSEPPLAHAIQATLGDIAGDTPALAPSALLALHLLGTRPTPARPSAHSVGHHTPTHAIPSETLLPHVRALLRHEHGPYTHAARITALRVIGERRLHGFHEDLARLAAGREETHTLVRIAAIAALGRIGDATARPILEGIDRADARLATAIDHAISHLPSSP